MKIGIISYNKYTFYGNYGSILQSYALFTYLKNQGYDVEIIDYRPGILKKRKTWFPYSIKSLIHPRMFLDFLYNEPCHVVRKIKFDHFLKTEVSFSKLKYNCNNFSDLNSKYNVILFGSDTIWDINQTNGFDVGFFGVGFKGMKIGYSISGADYIFNQQELTQLQTHISLFNKLSFRDDSIIKQLNNYSAPITLDPTFLLEENDYKKITKPKHYKNNYLLYFSLNNNKELDDYVIKLSEEKKLRVVCLSRFLAHAKKFHRNYRAGIEDFLSLIYYADFIVTNSFHGTVFSLIFNKQFCVYKRPGGNNKLAFLLNELDLNNRFINFNNNCTSEIDYTLVNAKLQELRKESERYIKDALSNGESNG